MKGHEYCRILLADVMKDVRAKYSTEEIKKVWTWDAGGGRKQFEFNGPNDEYIHNLKMADCHWSAKAEGWMKLIDRKEFV